MLGRRALALAFSLLFHVDGARTTVPTNVMQTEIPSTDTATVEVGKSLLEAEVVEASNKSSKWTKRYKTNEHGVKTRVTETKIGRYSHRHASSKRGSTTHSKNGKWEHYHDYRHNGHGGNARTNTKTKSAGHSHQHKTSHSYSRRSGVTKTQTNTDSTSRAGGHHGHYHGHTHTPKSSSTGTKTIQGSHTTHEHNFNSR